MCAVASQRGRSACIIRGTRPVSLVVISLKLCEEYFTNAQKHKTRITSAGCAFSVTQSICVLREIEAYEEVSTQQSTVKPAVIALCVFHELSATTHT